MEDKAKPTVIFLPHGGGPMPLLGDKGHDAMVAGLQDTAARLKKPSAIIMISAHWEARVPTITAHAKPPMLYDYYGFPAQAYEIQYPAPGHPQLAQDMFSAMTQAGFEPALDEQRGFDHGLFVPLKIMYPDADIPCVQLSLVKNLDPLTHIKMGAALANLPQENLLIVGSGMSFHNLQMLLRGSNSEGDAHNQHFENWLIDSCTNTQHSDVERTQALIDWEAAPSARACHPREEHLLPLHVCYGITQQASKAHAQYDIMGKKASLFLW